MRVLELISSDIGHIVLDGVSNRTGILSNLVVEFLLSPGVWILTGTVWIQCQVNTESGVGFEVNPVTLFGTAGDSSIADWQVIYVGKSDTKYLITKKHYLVGNGAYFLNRIAGP